MKDINFSKTKFNIAWASVLVIFIGAVLYVPAVYFADQKKEVIYYKIPVPEITITNTTLENPFGLETETQQDSLEEDKLVIKETKLLITKDLRLGDIDPEVKELQKYLNNRGFLIAESGPGSPGQETERFGAGTHDAVIRFQEAYKDLLLKPYGLEKGTGIIGDLTRKFINS